MTEDKDDENREKDGQTVKGNEDRLSLPKEAQGRIGHHLRHVYGQLLAEPLPDKFSRLLEELAKSEKKQ